MSDSKQITGIFLSFSPEELECIYKALEDLGYEKDSKGMKGFIIQSLLQSELEEDETEEYTINDYLQDYIKNNPEVIENVKHGISTMVGKLLKSKR